MADKARVILRLKGSVTREEWELLYHKCKDPRLKERYHCMLLSFDFSWKQIAKILHRKYHTTLDWVRDYNAKGLQGLLPDWPEGPKPKLTPQQQSIVASAVLRGPQALGLPFSSWDTKTLAAWIHERFNFRLSRASVRLLLRRLGFTWHKPEHRYVMADRQSQQQFVQNLQVEAHKMGPRDILLFCDEASLNHHPRLHKAWLPRGLKSVVQTFGTHAKRHIYGAVNVFTGKLIYRISDKLRAVQFVEFLKQLMAAYPGRRIMLVLDGGKTHTAKVVGKFIEEYRAIEPIWLPPYSPRLNPVEQLWKELRAKAISNQFFAAVGLMVDVVIRFFEGLSKKVLLKFCSADYLLRLR